MECKWEVKKKKKSERMEDCWSVWKEAKGAQPVYVDGFLHMFLYTTIHVWLLIWIKLIWGERGQHFTKGTERVEFTCR